MDELVSQRPLIPAGLPVASVTLAEPGGTDPLFQRVTAAPLVNVRRLEVVEVVVPAEGEAP
jgi:cell shape-determining protein MreC